MTADTYKTELAEPTQSLLHTLESKNTPYIYQDYVYLCGQYSNLEYQLSSCIDYAQYLGEHIDKADWSIVTANLETIKRRLLAIEQDEAVFTAALVKAHAQTAPELDELEIVSIYMTVDPISFTDPQDRLLPMLVRGFAKKTYIDETVVFNAPLWFIRWIPLSEQYSGVQIHGIYDQIHDNEVLEIANTLWNPQYHGKHGPSIYVNPMTALLAAEKLACKV